MSTCGACKGLGVTSGRHWLGLLLMGLLEAGHCSLFPDNEHHTPRFKQILRDEGHPTRDLGELCTALAGREPDFHVGYDDLDRYNAVGKIIEAAGFDPKTWGICEECRGSG